MFYRKESQNDGVLNGVRPPTLPAPTEPLGLRGSNVTRFVCLFVVCFQKEAEARGATLTRLSRAAGAAEPLGPVRP